MMASLWRDALAGRDTQVVANCDDPMVVWAARDCASVTWVASGQRWHDDSWVCPACGAHIERADDGDRAAVGEELVELFGVRFLFLGLRREEGGETAEVFGVGPVGEGAEEVARGELAVGLLVEGLDQSR